MAWFRHRVDVGVRIRRCWLATGSRRQRSICSVRLRAEGLRVPEIQTFLLWLQQALTLAHEVAHSALSGSTTSACHHQSGASATTADNTRRPVSRSLMRHDPSDMLHMVTVGPGRSACDVAEPLICPIADRGYDAPSGTFWDI